MKERRNELTELEIADSGSCVRKAKADIHNAASYFKVLAGQLRKFQFEVQDENENWTEGATLAATLEDHELIDPNLSGETILYRLFHERGVKVFTERTVTEFCRCSQSRVENLLRSFSKQERLEMIGDDGVIGVTCEFCAAHRNFDPEIFD
jgi:redox-regulated HSP33 family molecular chaperone